jgi:hypothetical protein
MRLAKSVLARLALLLAVCATAVTTHAADDGLITKPSRYSAKETVARFEAAVKEREAAGATVFISRGLGLHARGTLLKG